MMENGGLQRLFDRLVLAGALLAVCVVVLGAYVRLSDAGLGCPDWPGCYGQLVVPGDAAAQQAYPDKPLEAHKAWKEMAHRYLAGTLGLVILSIFVVAWRGRGRLAVSPALPGVLLGLVLFQSALGMWTVTLLLKPVVVSAHLLCGMATLALLVWMAARRGGAGGDVDAAALAPWVVLGLTVLTCQIFLGGWTSSNYAALACLDFPRCQNAWLPPMDFAAAFHLVRELGVNADGSQLSPGALTAIHWTHRLGALVTLAYLGWLALMLLRTPALRSMGAMVGALLLVQVGLGIGNVLLRLPLEVAVAHNAGAALLLVALVLALSATSGASASRAH